LASIRSLVLRSASCRATCAQNIASCDFCFGGHPPAGAALGILPSHLCAKHRIVPSNTGAMQPEAGAGLPEDSRFGGHPPAGAALGILPSSRG